MKTHITKIMSWRKTIGCGAFLLIALNADLAKSQGTIISISGPPDTTHQYGAFLAVDGTLGGVSWVSTGAFSNVQISIALEGDAGATGIAYLTTRIGPGTTAANAVASASFAFPSTTSLTPVLSGFTLGAGTYYLLIQATTNGINTYGMWDGSPFPSITAAANVTTNGEYTSYNAIQSYAPATTFSESFITYRKYTITGFPVPEPSAAWLVLLGGVVVIYVRKCSRRSSQQNVV